MKRQEKERRLRAGRSSLSKTNNDDNSRNFSRYVFYFVSICMYSVYLEFGFCPVVVDCKVYVLSVE